MFFSQGRVQSSENLYLEEGHWFVSLYNDDGEPQPVEILLADSQGAGKPGSTEVHAIDWLIDWLIDRSIESCIFLVQFEYDFSTFFSTTSMFLVLISLNPDGVPLWYFKLKLFDLTECHKRWFSNPYIFATQWRRPKIF